MTHYRHSSTLLLPGNGVPFVSRAVQAIRRKLHIMRGLGSLWPAVARGGKLLLQGRVREFASKLFNEMPDARAIPARSGPPLFLAGHVMGTGGYDQVAFNVLKGLLAAGVNVCRDAGAKFRPEFVPLDLQPSEATRTDEPRLTIIPPHLLHRFAPDARTAVLTMWETDTLPPDAVKLLNRAALVIVPSAWGARCFRWNGVTVPIEVVPLGYDPEVFHPVSRKPKASTIVTFGTAGALDEGGIRKNVQQVIDLFRQAFPKERDVRLRVKITPSSPLVHTHGDDRIDVMNASLTPAELAEWYRSLTAFVNGSFGEGFGLHLLEAMACGRPLISTAFGGATAFFAGTLGYEIGHRIVEVRHAMYRGRWANPNDADLIAAMRQVYRDPDDAQRRGHLAALRAKHFTWDDTIRKLVIVLIRHGLLG